MEIETKEEALTLLDEMCEGCSMAKCFNGRKCRRRLNDTYCYQYRHLKEFIKEEK